MKIDNIKELQKVIQLCRKFGVFTIEVDNVKLSLGPVQGELKIDYSTDFPEANIRIPKYNPASPVEAATAIATSELTDEQLLFYSTGVEPGTESQQQ